MADDGFAESFMSQVAKAFGRVDYAVNCAGVLGKPMRSGETSIAEFDRVNNINYRGCWLSSRAQLKQMVQQSPLPSHDPSRSPQRGAIVNIASQLGIVSRPNARKCFIPSVRASEIVLNYGNSGILCFQVCHNWYDPSGCN